MKLDDFVLYFDGVDVLDREVSSSIGFNLCGFIVALALYSAFYTVPVVCHHIGEH